MQQDLLIEAHKLIGKATENGVALRVLGGLAIKYHCPSASQPPLARTIADIDVFGCSKQAKGIKKVFVELSYIPAQQFNALHGKKRLMFFEPTSQVRRDVFLDTFEMCHKFDFRNRLELDKFSISLSDLLITKLQVVEIEERDYKDVVCMTLDHQLTGQDMEDSVNKSYIAKICSDDWGIYKTFTQNLQKTLSYLQTLDLGDEKKRTVEEKIRDLQQTIENVPKSMRWKMRSRVGEKVVWYELPETPKVIKFDE